MNTIENGGKFNCKYAICIVDLFFGRWNFGILN